MAATENVGHANSPIFEVGVRWRRRASAAGLACSCSERLDGGLVSDRPSFADVKDLRRQGRCPRCHAPGVRAGDVRILLADALKRPQRTLVSKSIGFCEPCAVEVYQALHALLMREAKR